MSLTDDGKLSNEFVSAISGGAHTTTKTCFSLPQSSLLSGPWHGITLYHFPCLISYKSLQLSRESEILSFDCFVIFTQMPNISFDIFERDESPIARGQGWAISLHAESANIETASRCLADWQQDGPGVKIVPGRRHANARAGRQYVWFGHS